MGLMIASALHWDLAYLENNMGNAKHTVFLSRTHDMYMMIERSKDMKLHNLLITPIHLLVRPSIMLLFLPKTVLLNLLSMRMLLNLAVSMIKIAKNVACNCQLSSSQHLKIFHLICSGSA